MGDINTNIRIDELEAEVKADLKSINTKIVALPTKTWVNNTIANSIPTFTFSKRLENFPYTMNSGELYEFTACTEKLGIDDRIPNFKISVDGFGNYYINGAIYYEKTYTNNAVIIFEFMKKDLSKFYVQVNQTTGYTELVTP